ncbi:hypothetical protein BEL04_04150 [Mucilaginibacter sp. PPCGB 2223]|nr:hypothetical protein BEL04_04150 [Mucilaginibacter sp. PPCGB 2223]
MTIRKVALADLDALLLISRQTFFDAFEAVNNPEDFKAYTDVAFTKAKFESELTNPHSEFYLAVNKDDILGYIKLNFATAQTEFQNNDSAEVERLYVSSTHQNKQIGQQLLNFALDTARSRKLKYVWLGVWENNSHAIRFYQRNGFSIFSSHYFMVGNDRQTDLLMKKMV